MGYAGGAWSPQLQRTEKTKNTPGEMRRLPRIAAARATKHIAKTSHMKDELIMATPSNHKLHNVIPTGTLSIKVATPDRRSVASN